MFLQSVWWLLQVTTSAVWPREAFGHSGQSIPGHCPPDPLPGSTRDFVCQAECERTGSIARIGDGTSDVWENGIG